MSYYGVQNSFYKYVFKITTLTEFVQLCFRIREKVVYVYYLAGKILSE